MQQTIQRLEDENADLKAKLEEGFAEAVKAFSETLHDTLDGGFNSSQYLETHPMGLERN